ncbi:MAG TPA: DUF3179 domain-containing (seleno)protein, partial [Gemmatimonadales bacterium]
AGINNQNFIMEDRETGSWWQQVSGEAIQGPLKGTRLARVFHDELSFGDWMREVPGGRVLRPAADTAWIRFSRGWEEETAGLPVRVNAPLDPALEPRAVVAGVQIGATAKAYPMDRVRAQAPVHDRVGGVPIVLLIGPDGKSVRVFEARLDSLPLEFLRPVGGPPGEVIDAGSAGRWSFRGEALSGPWQGRRLKPVFVLLDYWFDWKTYHPATGLYTLGAKE